ncbi:MAG: dicarboxylate/amino acid:cation symporter [Bacteroidales bacterium]|nr:dicarboxylate/amino acid:cation symporter [Bacteroidales bacterium]
MDVKRKIKNRKFPLYAKILIGMALGIIGGLLASRFHWISFTDDWVKPWGTIFIKLLKLIAMPLIVVSLVNGIVQLKDISRLSALGLRTIIFYIITTTIAIVVGLGLANSIQPGKFISVEKRQALLTESAQKFTIPEKTETGPLDFVENLVPDNIVNAAANNRNMLQVIFFAFLFGISLLLVKNEKKQLLVTIFEVSNDVILRMIDLIMKYAPIGVFALMMSLIVDFTGDDLSGSVELFSALGMYSLTVVIGLLFMILVIYPLALRFFSRIRPFKFFKGIFPAQLLAFSTSSSAATLPVTMEQCQKELDMSEEVTGFVLPIGATINMDGTSLYQSVAAIFIAQVFGIELSLSEQLTIVATALLASVGAAAVPGAGIIMLIIVLTSVGLPVEGIVIIMAVDRILDMLRTVVNVTSDATVTAIVDTHLKQAENGN